MVSDQAACEKAGGVWVSDGQGGGFCYMKLEGEDMPPLEEIPVPDLDDPFGSSNSSSAHGSDLYVRKKPGRSSDGGGSGTGDAKSGAVDHNSTRSNRGVSGDGGEILAHIIKRKIPTGDGGTGDTGVATVRPKRRGRTSFGELITKSGKLVTSTVGTAGKAISLALLLVAVAAGGDIYQTIGDATEINLVDHITRTDGQSSEDGSSIEVELGLDIPEMGYIEKRLDVSVHIKILESDPTTEADYTFEYTLGEGERIYEFVLEDLDPVTASKVKAGDPIDIEYSGSVTVVYFGIELAPTTTEIPLDVFTINV